MSYDFPDGPDWNPEPQGDEYTGHERDPDYPDDPPPVELPAE